MALEASFQELDARLRSACEAFTDLRVAVVEDVPQRGAPLLVDQLGDAATDLSVSHGKHVVAYGIIFAAAGVMGWFSYHAFRRRTTPPQWATLTAIGLVWVALLVIRFA